MLLLKPNGFFLNMAEKWRKKNLQKKLFIIAAVAFVKLPKLHWEFSDVLFHAEKSFIHIEFSYWQVQDYRRYRLTTGPAKLPACGICSGIIFIVWSLLWRQHLSPIRPAHLPFMLISAIAGLQEHLEKIDFASFADWGVMRPLFLCPYWHVKSHDQYTC